MFNFFAQLKDKIVDYADRLTPSKLSAILIGYFEHSNGKYIPFYRVVSNVINDYIPGKQVFHCYTNNKGKNFAVFYATSDGANSSTVSIPLKLAIKVYKEFIQANTDIELSDLLIPIHATSKVREHWFALHVNFKEGNPNKRVTIYDSQSRSYISIIHAGNYGLNLEYINEALTDLMKENSLVNHSYHQNNNEDNDDLHEFEMVHSLEVNIKHTDQQKGSFACGRFVIQNLIHCVEENKSKLMVDDINQEVRDHFVWLYNMILYNGRSYNSHKNKIQIPDFESFRVRKFNCDSINFDNDQSRAIPALPGDWWDDTCISIYGIESIKNNQDLDNSRQDDETSCIESFEL